MSMPKNVMLVIGIAIILAFFLYFYREALMNNVIKTRLSLNDWFGRNGFGWIPALFTFGLGVIIGWLIFGKPI